MKNITCFLVLSISIVFSAAAGAGLTIVSGHVDREAASSLILFEVIEGKKVEYASTLLDANHDFAFALPSAKEGFYYLSTQSRKDFTRIYLVPGEQLNMQIGEEGYEIVKGSAENKLLYEWYKTAEVITRPAFNWMKDSSTYLSFFPKLEKFVQLVPGFKSKIKTKNKHFNELMNLAVDMDVDHAAMYFLMTPNTIHPKKEQYPSFYGSIIKANKFNDARLLELGEGIEILNRYINLAYMLGKADVKAPNRLLAASDLITNDSLKGAFVSNSLYTYRTYESLTAAIEPVKKYLVTDSMQAAYFRALKSVASFKKGGPAYNFSYPDIAGKNVSMNDLKGKVVVLDIWATWCGPCRAEVPHLKELEEAMKGKNVEFISISVDEEKNKEKWKSMIAKDHLGGTQLFASGWSDIAKYYNITGIPRFMVFDQEGKIVSVDSPRPSDPALKKLLDDTLDGK